MDAGAIATGGGLVAGAGLWWYWRRRRASRARPPAVRTISLADRLAQTRERLRGVAEGKGGGLDQQLATAEEALIGADVGSSTAKAVVERLRARLERGEEWSHALRESIVELLRADEPPPTESRPWVVLVVGVNGVGKTTTIGKLAARHRAASRRVLLVAADTFRAAAAEQLVVWGERVGADVVRHQAGGSPAAVVFDGLKAALARGMDVVLIDSAGRLHTRKQLMEELEKIRRVIGREIPGAPHETLLVIDATTGQNALAQAREFVDATGATAVALTKLDGTARGGVALAIRRELGIPIRYVGVGEAVEDLREFDAVAFASALVGG